MKRIWLIPMVLSLSFLASPMMADEPAELPAMGVTAPMEAYFYAQGEPVSAGDPGGYGLSGTRYDDAPRQAPAGELSLIVDTEAAVPFREFRGFTVILANRSGAAVELRAADSRLRIWREAQDPNGKWRPIEFQPPVRCGLSYHMLTLPNDKAWTFAAPVYDGDFETAMRFVVNTPSGDIRSNEFQGVMDLGQFGRSAQGFQ